MPVFRDVFHRIFIAVFLAMLCVLFVTSAPLFANAQEGGVNICSIPRKDAQGKVIPNKFEYDGKPCEGTGTCKGGSCKIDQATPEEKAKMEAEQKQQNGGGGSGNSPDSNSVRSPEQIAKDLESTQKEILTADPETRNALDTQVNELKQLQDIDAKQAAVEKQLQELGNPETPAAKALLDQKAALDAQERQINAALNGDIKALQPSQDTGSAGSSGSGQQNTPGQSATGFSSGDQGDAQGSRWQQISDSIQNAVQNAQSTFDAAREAIAQRLEQIYDSVVNPETFQAQQQLEQDMQLAQTERELRDATSQALDTYTQNKTAENLAAYNEKLATYDAYVRDTLPEVDLSNSKELENFLKKGVDTGVLPQDAVAAGEAKAAAEQALKDAEAKYANLAPDAFDREKTLKNINELKTELQKATDRLQDILQDSDVRTLATYSDPIATQHFVAPTDTDFRGLQERLSPALADMQVLGQQLNANVNTVNALSAEFQLFAQDVSASIGSDARSPLTAESLADAYAKEAQRNLDYASEVQKKIDEAKANSSMSSIRPGLSWDCIGLCRTVEEPGLAGSTRVPEEAYFRNMESILEGAKSDAVKYQSIADFLKSGNPLATNDLAQKLAEGGFVGGKLSENIAAYQAEQTRLNVGLDPYTGSANGSQEKADMLAGNIERLTGGEANLTDAERNVMRQQQPLGMTPEEAAREAVARRLAGEPDQGLLERLANPKSIVEGVTRSIQNAYNAIFDPTLAQQNERLTQTPGEIFGSKVFAVGEAALNVGLLTPTAGRLLESTMQGLAAPLFRSDIASVVSVPADTAFAVGEASRAGYALEAAQGEWFAARASGIGIDEASANFARAEQAAILAQERLEGLGIRSASLADGSQTLVRDGTNDVLATRSSVIEPWKVTDSVLAVDSRIGAEIAPERPLAQNITREEWAAVRELDAATENLNAVRDLGAPTTASEERALASAEFRATAAENAFTEAGLIKDDFGRILNPEKEVIARELPYKTTEKLGGNYEMVPLGSVDAAPVAVKTTINGEPVTIEVKPQTTTGAPLLTDSGPSFQSGLTSAQRSALEEYSAARALYEDANTARALNREAFVSADANLAKAEANLERNGISIPRDSSPVALETSRPISAANESVVRGLPEGEQAAARATARDYERLVAEKNALPEAERTFADSKVFDTREQGILDRLAKNGLTADGVTGEVRAMTQAEKTAYQAASDARALAAREAADIKTDARNADRINPQANQRVLGNSLLNDTIIAGDKIFTGIKSNVSGTLSNIRSALTNPRSLVQGPALASQLLTGAGDIGTFARNVASDVFKSAPITRDAGQLVGNTARTAAETPIVRAAPSIMNAAKLIEGVELATIRELAQTGALALRPLEGLLGLGVNEIRLPESPSLAVQTSVTSPSVPAVQTSALSPTVLPGENTPTLNIDGTQTTVMGDVVYASPVSDVNEFGFEKSQPSQNPVERFSQVIQDGISNVFSGITGLSAARADNPIVSSDLLSPSALSRRDVEGVKIEFVAKTGTIEDLREIYTQSLKGSGGHPGTDSYAWPGTSNADLLTKAKLVAYQTNNPGGMKWPFLFELMGKFENSGTGAFVKGKYFDNFNVAKIASNGQIDPSSVVPGKINIIPSKTPFVSFASFSDAVATMALKAAYQDAYKNVSTFGEMIVGVDGKGKWMAPDKISQFLGDGYFAAAGIGKDTKITRDSTNKVLAEQIANIALGISTAEYGKLFGRAGVVDPITGKGVQDAKQLITAEVIRDGLIKAGYGKETADAWYINNKSGKIFVSNGQTVSAPVAANSGATLSANPLGERLVVAGKIPTGWVQVEEAQKLPDGSTRYTFRSTALDTKTEIVATETRVSKPDVVLKGNNFVFNKFKQDFQINGYRIGELRKIYAETEDSGLGLFLKSVDRREAANRITDNQFIDKELLGAYISVLRAYQDKYGEVFTSNAFSDTFRDYISPHTQGKAGDIRNTNLTDEQQEFIMDQFELAGFERDGKSIRNDVHGTGPHIHVNIPPGYRPPQTVASNLVLKSSETSYKLATRNIDTGEISPYGDGKAFALNQKAVQEARIAAAEPMEPKDSVIKLATQPNVFRPFSLTDLKQRTFVQAIGLAGIMAQASKTVGETRSEHTELSKEEIDKARVEAVAKNLGIQYAKRPDGIYSSEGKRLEIRSLGTVKDPAFVAVANAKGKFDIPGVQRMEYLKDGAWEDPTTVDKKKYVVIHYTAATAGGRNTALEQAANGYNKKGTMLYVLQDGTVIVIRPESATPNHIGTNKPLGYPDATNENAIGIEFETIAAEGLSPGQISSGLALIRFLQQRYGIDADHVVAHAKDYGREGVVMTSLAKQMNYHPQTGVPIVGLFARGESKQIGAPQNLALLDVGPMLKSGALLADARSTPNANPGSVSSSGNVVSTASLTASGNNANTVESQTNTNTTRSAGENPANKQIVDIRNWLGSKINTDLKNRGTVVPGGMKVTSIATEKSAPYVFKVMSGSNSLGTIEPTASVVAGQTLPQFIYKDSSGVTPSDLKPFTLLDLPGVVAAGSQVTKVASLTAPQTPISGANDTSAKRPTVGSLISAPPLIPHYWNEGLNGGENTRDLIAKMPSPVVLQVHEARTVNEVKQMLDNCTGLGKTCYISFYSEAKRTTPSDQSSDESNGQDISTRIERMAKLRNELKALGGTYAQAVLNLVEFDGFDEIPVKDFTSKSSSGKVLKEMGSESIVKYARDKGFSEFVLKNIARTKANSDPDRITMNEVAALGVKPAYVVVEDTAYNREGNTSYNARAIDYAQNTNLPITLTLSSEAVSKGRKININGDTVAQQFAKYPQVTVTAAEPNGARPVKIASAGEVLIGIGASSIPAVAETTNLIKNWNAERSLLESLAKNQSDAIEIVNKQKQVAEKAFADAKAEQLKLKAVQTAALPSVNVVVSEPAPAQISISAIDAKIAPLERQRDAAARSLLTLYPNIKDISQLPAASINDGLFARFDRRQFNSANGQIAALRITQINDKLQNNQVSVDGATRDALLVERNKQQAIIDSVLAENKRLEEAFYQRFAATQVKNGLTLETLESALKALNARMENTYGTSWRETLDVEQAGVGVKINVSDIVFLERLKNQVENGTVELAQNKTSIFSDLYSSLMNLPGRVMALFAREATPVEVVTEKEKPIQDATPENTIPVSSQALARTLAPQPAVPTISVQAQSGESLAYLAIQAQTAVSYYQTLKALQGVADINVQNAQKDLDALQKTQSETGPKIQKINETIAKMTQLNSDIQNAQKALSAAEDAGRSADVARTRDTARSALSVFTKTLLPSLETLRYANPQSVGADIDTISNDLNRLRAELSRSDDDVAAYDAKNGEGAFVKMVGRLARQQLNRANTIISVTATKVLVQMAGQAPGKAFKAPVAIASLTDNVKKLESVQSATNIAILKASTNLQEHKKLAQLIADDALKAQLDASTAMAIVDAEHVRMIDEKNTSAVQALLDLDAFYSRSGVVDDTGTLAIAEKWDRIAEMGPFQPVENTRVVTTASLGTQLPINAGAHTVFRGALTDLQTGFPSFISFRSRDGSASVGAGSGSSGTGSFTVTAPNSLTSYTGNSVFTTGSWIPYPIGVFSSLVQAANSSDSSNGRDAKEEFVELPQSVDGYSITNAQQPHLEPPQSLSASELIGVDGVSPASPGVDGVSSAASGDSASPSEVRNSNTVTKDKVSGDEASTKNIVSKDTSGQRGGTETNSVGTKSATDSRGGNSSMGGSLNSGSFASLLTGLMRFIAALLGIQTTPATGIQTCQPLTPQPATSTCPAGAWQARYDSFTGCSIGWTCVSVATTTVGSNVQTQKPSTKSTTTTTIQYLTPAN